SCVYWPPKSSTTTPPRSDCGFRCSSCSFAPVVMAGSVVMLLGYNEIEQFVRYVNSFDDAFSVEMRRDGGVLPGYLHDGIFFRASGDFQATAHFAVYLHGNFDFVFACKFSVMRRPRRLPKTIGMPKDLPKLFGKM